MSKKAMRKTPRGRPPETNGPRTRREDEPQRDPLPANPRRPNRVLLAVSGSLFLLWMIALAWLAISA
jgi:hypothetical protein